MRSAGSCPRNKERILFVFFQFSPSRPQFPGATNSCNSRPVSAYYQSLRLTPFPLHLFSFAFSHRSRPEAGRGVAVLILAGAKRGRWLVLSEFAKYAFCGLKRKRRDFERSVLMYVSIKIPALTHSGRKSWVCVNALDRLCPRHKTPPAFICLRAFLPSSTRQCPRTGQTTNTARPHQAK